MQTGVCNSEQDVPVVSAVVVSRPRCYIIGNWYRAATTAGTAPLHVRLDVLGAENTQSRPRAGRLKPRSLVDGSLDHQHRAERT